MLLPALCSCVPAKKQGSPDAIRLCRFVRNSELDKLQQEIDSGTPLDELASDGKAALHIAAELNNVEAARMLIEGGADIEVQDWRADVTPVGFAVHHKAHEVTELLLDKRADPYQTGYSEMSVILLAMTADDYEMVKKLIDRGVDIDDSDRGGDTPLHYSVVPVFDIKYFDLLIQSGADTTARNAFGESVYEYAVKMKASPERLEYIRRYLPEH